MNKDILPILATSPLFAGILPAAAQSMLDCLQPKILHYDKTTYIASEDELFTGLGILLAGEAAVIKENAAGTRSVLTVISAGDMFGEMIAFSTRQTWPASVVAQTNCSVVFLPPQKITGECSNLCGSHQKLIRNLLQILSEKAIILNRKVEYLSIRSLRAKIATYLLEQYKEAEETTFVLPLNRSNLADFLSASRTALSREMGRMRDEGLIEFYRSSIKIIALDKLNKAVE